MVTIIDPHIKRDGNYHIHKVVAVGVGRGRGRWALAVKTAATKLRFSFYICDRICEKGPFCSGAECLFLIVHNFKARL